MNLRWNTEQGRVGKLKNKGQLLLFRRKAKDMGGSAVRGATSTPRRGGKGKENSRQKFQAVETGTVDCQRSASLN